ncbi:MAG: hypothetical protein VW600_06905 [Ferrovibrio sp.]
MRITGTGVVGFLVALICQPAAAQQAKWVEFPAAQSRIEFAVSERPTKPSRGWELQGASSGKVRNYQYLWGVPFQGSGAFSRVFVAQLTDAASYFTIQPEWQKMETLPEFTRGADFRPDAALIARTDGLGSLNARAFSSQGRSCVAFGGLTHTGSTSQLLYGEAAASGDTSVRGYYCAPEKAPLGTADIPGILQKLRFK